MVHIGESDPAQPEGSTLQQGHRGDLRVGRGSCQHPAWLIPQLVWRAVHPERRSAYLSTKKSVGKIARGVTTRTFAAIHVDGPSDNQTAYIFGIRQS